MPEDDHITIDLLKPSYFESYLSHFSPKIQQSLQNISLEHEIAYLMHHYHLQQLGFTYFYCILMQSLVIGAIEIRNKIVFPGQLYCWVNEEYWHTGIFQKAFALVARDYYKKNKENSIVAHVDVNNKQSYTALRKCGFIQEILFLGPWGWQYKLIHRHIVLL